MAKFYFTYGSSESMPFQGGWTEIEVTGPGTSDVLAGQIACGAFRAVHPDPYPNAPLQCAGVYREEDFKKTSMHQVGRNLGKGCVERIRIEVQR